MIFSDSSAIGGNVGATAILNHAGQLHQMLHYHLGPDSEHMVHEAELIGVFLAVHLIQTKENAKVSITIGVDNQAALGLFNMELNNPAHNIAREIIGQGNILKKGRGCKAHQITLQWTAGHEGILGNELADLEVKKAADGLTSDKCMLPCFLRHKLTTNPSTVKQKHDADLKNKWKSEWCSSHRGKKLVAIDANTPSAFFLQSISKADLSCRSASMITQLITAHIPLNSYLKRINKVDSVRSPSCRATNETVWHFLLACPGYAHEQWALEARLKEKHKHLTYNNILGNADFFVPLANYINMSHRFSPMNY